MLRILQNNTFSPLFVGKNIVTLKKVNSTNTYLKDALSKSAPFPEGTVIMAEEQFSGRGQTNKLWESESGKNLTFSILLNPVFLPIDKQFELNEAICLALNDVLTTYIGDSVKIKWPNDSYAGNKKIAGLLIENIIQGNQIKHAIVGIGLNVNQTNFPTLLQNATSLKKILQNDYDLPSLLNEICSAIEARYLQLRANRKEFIHQAYLDKLYLIGKWSPFKIDGEIQNGKIYGVTKEGYLMVEFIQGCRQFALKEIEFINSQDQ